MGLKLDKYKEIVKNENVFCEIGKVCEIIGLIIEADGPKIMHWRFMSYKKRHLVVS